MRLKSIYVFLLTIAFCAGCTANQSVETATPNFATAILPTALLQSTPTIEVFMPMTHTAAPTLSPVEGTTTTQVNVREQPNKESTSLGMLSIFSKVQIFGKDASGGWYQILYANATGWVSAQYVQVNTGTEIPFIATNEPTTAPVGTQPTVAFLTAMQDGDSMQMPLAAVDFSETDARGLQLNGDISAPGGDTEDWLQFTPHDDLVWIKIQCTGNGVTIELWKDGTRLGSFPLACNNEKIVTVIPNEKYFARLSPPNLNEMSYIRYTALLENIR